MIDLGPDGGLSAITYTSCVPFVGSDIPYLITYIYYYIIVVVATMNFFLYICVYIITNK
jgi:hypothetical protein